MAEPASTDAADPTEGHGCCLWLMPEPDIAAELEADIRRASQHLGTPLFAPHLTFVYGLSAPASFHLEATRRIASQVPPLELSTRGLAWTPYFFRALYLELHPCEALSQGRQLARTQLGLAEIDDSATPPPHISLLYGHPDPKQRAEILRRLACTWPDTVRLSHLALWQVAGAPAAWREVERVRLGTTDS